MDYIYGLYMDYTMYIQRLYIVQNSHENIQVVEGIFRAPLQSELELLREDDLRERVQRVHQPHWLQEPDLRFGVWGLGSGSVCGSESMV